MALHIYILVGELWDLFSIEGFVSGIYNCLWLKGGSWWLLWFGLQLIEGRVK